MRRAAFFANGSRPADWRLLLGCCLSVASAVAGTAQAIPLKAHPFSLRDVRLLDGPFKHAQDLDAAYLLTLDSDRLLARFREYAGLPSKGTHYGGWEAESLSGHTLGHYLSACSLMFEARGDERFKQRVDYIVDELAACQAAHGDGLVAGFPDCRKAFAEVAAGHIRARSFNLNGIWSPFYTLHKLFAGLRDAHHLCGNRRALEIQVKLADWVEQTLSGLSDGPMQQVLACEFGGMNEVLADLCADTGDARWLKLSHRFDHKAVLEPLARREDRLDGLHANTQIPKIVGLARRYALTGAPSDRAMAEFFWERAAHHHAYVTGGNSESEYFGPPDQLNHRLTDRTTETCNTYNLLKLTRQLFQFDPQPAYADFYERALYNHILASQDPASGMVTYFVPLRSGFAKTYTTPFETFTCCLGTGMETHAKHADSIYFQDREALWVNLFIASELNWKEKGLIVRQETRFPDDGSVKFGLQCSRPVELALRIRCPRWVSGSVSIALNGKAESVKARPGSFVELRRTWRDSDRVEISFPMPLRLESMPDNPNRVALFHGPVLLAGDLGPTNDAGALQFDYAPVWLTKPASLLKRIEPVPGQPSTFRTVGVGQPRDVTLIPFHRMHHRRYAVYWDLVTPKQQAQRQAANTAEQSRWRELESRTVDFVKAGDTNSEAAHQLKGDKMESEDFCGRLYRLSRGGQFSYELKVLPDQPVALVCTCWGGERPGSRIFDIRVEDEVIATQTLATNKPGEFFDATYPVPYPVTRGKPRVTVSFVSHGEKYAGGLFGLRIVKSVTSGKSKGLER